MPKHFFTNHGPQTLLAKFEGVFSTNKDLAAFDALVGYLRSAKKLNGDLLNAKSDSRATQEFQTEVQNAIRRVKLLRSTLLCEFAKVARKKVQEAQ